MYIFLAKYHDVQCFDDDVVFLHQFPTLIMFVLGFFYPIMWCFACLHLIAHFFIETIFLAYHQIYDFLIHHTYITLFLSLMLSYTPSYVIGMTIPPMLNNLFYHWAVAKNHLRKTKFIRQIYFLLFRIIYPPFATLYVIIFTDLNVLIKMLLSIFAGIIVMIMIPKINKK